jgi:hypothetical protein
MRTIASSCSRFSEGVSVEYGSDQNAFYLSIESKPCTSLFLKHQLNRIGALTVLVLLRVKGPETLDTLS